MSRKPRFVLPGVPRHVVQRGHNGEPRFFPRRPIISATCKTFARLH